MTTTPTGVPIVECDRCGKRHPWTRLHCEGCGSASVFQMDGLCVKCRRE